MRSCSRRRPTSGARPVRTFLTVTLPLSMPGVIAGSMLVFIPAIGEYVIPTLLGGRASLMIGRVTFDEFFANRDWPMASALAFAMLLVVVVPIMLMQNAQNAVVSAAMKRGPLIPIIATLGFVFLYAPIIWLVVFSFNDNRLVTVWGGFTTRWYGELFANEKLLAAAILLARDRNHLPRASRWCSARSAPWRWCASAASAASRCWPRPSRRRW